MLPGFVTNFLWPSWFYTYKLYSPLLGIFSFNKRENLWEHFMGNLMFMEVKAPYCNGLLTPAILITDWQLLDKKTFNRIQRGWFWVRCPSDVESTFFAMKDPLWPVHTAHILDGLAMELNVIGSPSVLDPMGKILVWMGHNLKSNRLATFKFSPEPLKLSH